MFELRSGHKVPGFGHDQYLAARRAAGFDSNTDQIESRWMAMPFDERLSIIENIYSHTLSIDKVEPCNELWGSW